MWLISSGNQPKPRIVAWQRRIVAVTASVVTAAALGGGNGERIVIVVSGGLYYWLRSTSVGINVVTVEQAYYRGVA